MIELSQGRFIPATSLSKYPVAHRSIHPARIRCAARRIILCSITSGDECRIILRSNHEQNQGISLSLSDRWTVMSQICDAIAACSIKSSGKQLDEQISRTAEERYKASFDRDVIFLWIPIGAHIHSWMHAWLFICRFMSPASRHLKTRRHQIAASHAVRALIHIWFDRSAPRSRSRKIFGDKYGLIDHKIPIRKTREENKIKVASCCERVAERRRRRRRCDSIWSCIAALVSLVDTFAAAFLKPPARSMQAAGTHAACAAVQFAARSGGAGIWPASCPPCGGDGRRFRHCRQHRICTVLKVHAAGIPVWKDRCFSLKDVWTLNLKCWTVSETC